ncbi:MAG: DsrE family protein [Desulfobacterales bacterium]|nr:DsrE family protein [Desulfobacterales bacterium]
MQPKYALFAFQGEMMCFAHVLLHAIDMNEKGYDVKIIIEGSATKLISDLADPKKPFAAIYSKVKSLGLIDCICKACATKMGTLHEAETQQLKIHGDMSGHPSMTQYISNGYQIISF